MTDPQDSRRTIFRATATVVALACCVGTHAAEWRPSLSVNTGVTYSDNLFLAPPGPNKRSDLFLRATPNIGLSGEGARLKLRFNYAPSFFYYLNTPLDDYLFNRLSATAKLEAVENLVYLDASAQIAENFLTPFAPQSPDLANQIDNRIETRSYRVSPYVQRRLTNGVQYLLRNDFSKTATDNPQLPQFTRNRLTARLQGNPETFAAWQVEYQNFQSDIAPFNIRQSGQFVRFQSSFSVLYDLRVFPIVGYETNNYGFTDYRGAIYGGGLAYTPSPRTQFSAQAEERFFGTSYNVALTHRTRMTSWGLNASRSVTFWEAPLFTLPPGPTEFALDQILQSRISDPAERQAAVDNILQSSGLPPVITAPYQFFTTQLFTREGINATVGLLGVRNSLFFRLFTTDSEPVTVGSGGVGDVFTQFARIESVGGSISGTHQLSGLTRVGADVTRTNSKGTNRGGAAGDTTFSFAQNIYRLSLTHQLGPRTTGTLGLRYQTFNFLGPQSEERAILATLNHQFF
jgi:uncharacterized protein (PEP-CTERM system associated)